ncbi:MAG: hypothetical protein ACTSYO_06505 [Candidatus Ranarchaeia archaeon]
MNIPVMILGSIILIVTILIRSYLVHEKHPPIVVIQRYNNQELEYLSQVLHNNMWLILGSITLILGASLQPLYTYGQIWVPMPGLTEEQFYSIADVSFIFILLLVFSIVGDVFIKWRITSVSEFIPPKPIQEKPITRHRIPWRYVWLPLGTAILPLTLNLWTLLFGQILFSFSLGLVLWNLTFVIGGVILRSYSPQAWSPVWTTTYSMDRYKTALTTSALVNLTLGTIWTLPDFFRVVLGLSWDLLFPAYQGQAVMVFLTLGSFIIVAIPWIYQAYKEDQLKHKDSNEPYSISNHDS